MSCCMLIYLHLWFILNSVRLVLDNNKIIMKLFTGHIKLKLSEGMDNSDTITITLL